MIRYIAFIFIPCTVVMSATVAVNEKAKDRDFELFGDTQENFEKQIKPLREGISKSKALMLFEGLPHQFHEKALLESELKTKKSIKLHGFPFYEEGITPKGAAVKDLSDLCTSPKSLTRYAGAHRCGGFHPDWCVEFKDGDASYKVLICFGCGESRVYCPRNELWTWVDENSMKELSKVLVPYAKNRPAKKGRE